MNKIDELIITHGQAANCTRAEMGLWFEHLEKQIPLACISWSDEEKFSIRLFALSNQKYALLKTARFSDNNPELPDVIYLFDATQRGLQLASEKFDELWKEQLKCDS